MLEILAVFVHGAVSFGNALGLFFNLKNRNWKWAAIHAGGVAAHVIATVGHARDARRDAAK
jgi:hypothetical protein